MREEILDKGKLSFIPFHKHSWHSDDYIGYGGEHMTGFVGEGPPPMTSTWRGQSCWCEAKRKIHRVYEIPVDAEETLRSLAFHD